MASDTSIAEGATVQVGLPTWYSLAAVTHMGPQGLRFGTLAVSRLKGITCHFTSGIHSLCFPRDVSTENMAMPDRHRW